MKQTLKVGQKYRVIKDSLNKVKKGNIVTVKEIDISFGEYYFYDKNSYNWNLELDKLQLINPKKSQWKNTRKDIVWYVNQISELYLPECAKESLINFILAKSTPKKKFKEIKQEDKKESTSHYCQVDKPQKPVKCTVTYTGGDFKFYKTLSPSLLNDIETIEEIPLDDGDCRVRDIVNLLIKNDRIHTQILNLLIKNK